MDTTLRHLILILLLVTVTACGNAPTIPPAPTTTPIPRPAWQQILFTELRGGTAISFASLQGKRLVVQITASWCVACQAQEQQISAAIQRIGDPALVHVRLYTDGSEDTAKLTALATKAGTSSVVALSTQALNQALVQTYNGLLANPPNLPLFIIEPTGAASTLYTGERTDADLEALIRGK